MPSNSAPVSTFIIGVEQSEIGDDVLFVVCGERWTDRREISDLRIELRLFHTGPRFLAKRVIKDQPFPMAQVGFGRKKPARRIEEKAWSTKG